jgi:hypothetical protein
MGSDQFGCGEDRLHGGDAAQLDPARRADRGLRDGMLPDGDQAMTAESAGRTGK